MNTTRQSELIMAKTLRITSWKQGSKYLGSLSSKNTWSPWTGFIKGLSAAVSHRDYLNTFFLKMQRRPQKLFWCNFWTRFELFHQWEWKSPSGWGRSLAIESLELLLATRCLNELVTVFLLWFLSSESEVCYHAVGYLDGFLHRGLLQPCLVEL